LENYKVTIVAGLFFVGLVVIAIWGERLWVWLFLFLCMLW